MPDLMHAYEVSRTTSTMATVPFPTGRAWQASATLRRRTMIGTELDAWLDERVHATGLIGASVRRATATTSPPGTPSDWAGQFRVCPGGWSLVELATRSASRCQARFRG